MKTAMPAVLVLMALVIGAGSLFLSVTGLFGGGGPSSFWDLASNLAFLGLLGLALGIIIKSLSS